MDDVSGSAATRLPTSRVALKLVADRTLETIPQGTYVSMRLEEIAAEQRKMLRECDRLFAELNCKPDNDTPRREELRQRRAYLIERLAIIRMERAALAATPPRAT